MVGQLEALIGEHPYRERLRTQLTPALYRCDRFICMRGAWVEPDTAFAATVPGERNAGCVYASWAWVTTSTPQKGDERVRSVTSMSPS